MFHPLLKNLKYLIIICLCSRTKQLYTSNSQISDITKNKKRKHS
nr:MAG TPA: hypothetical protein [Caudoviricetes sp.]